MCLKLILFDSLTKQCYIFFFVGHPGEGDVGNYVLQAKGARVLTVPYICSGGVGDGKQVAAALALGADGVNIGTRFCATQECMWPESFKDRMLNANEEDTVLMFRRLKNTTRVFANKVAKEVESIESKKGADFKFEDVAHLVAGTRGRAAEKAGDAEGGMLHHKVCSAISSEELKRLLQPFSPFSFYGCRYLVSRAGSWIDQRHTHCGRLNEAHYARV